MRVLGSLCVSAAMRGLPRAEQGDEERCEVPVELRRSATEAVALDVSLGHAALVRALAPHSSRRVLRFTDLRQPLAAFPSAADRNKCDPARWSPLMFFACQADSMDKDPAAHIAAGNTCTCGS